MKTDYTGIDYSMGLPMANGKVPNVDSETGIRYGVIPIHDVIQAWSDSSEAEYPERESDDDESDDDCDLYDYSEPIAFVLNNEEYQAVQDADDCDIFVIKSPFYTFAQFCSPCAPGACYLRNPVDSENEGNKCYCLGLDFFDPEASCPYPIWRVDTGEKIYEPKE